MVGDTQFAFGKGKHVHDGVHVANEWVEEYKQFGKKGFVLKLELENTLIVLIGSFRTLHWLTKVLAANGGNALMVLYQQPSFWFSMA